MYNQKKYELLYLKIYEGREEEFDSMLLEQMENEKEKFLIKCNHMKRFK